MIGMILVTHGRLAEEFIAALTHVMGPQKAIEAICVGPQDDTSLCLENIRAAVKKVNTGDGVVILTDLFGGTPSNLALSLMDTEGVEVIAGVNLPLLIKLAELRDNSTLRVAVSSAREAGQKYIKVASEQ